MKELEKLRRELDGIDDQVLELLNKRTRIVLDIAHIKRNRNAKFYSPERERSILQRLANLNKGPFPDCRPESSIQGNPLGLFVSRRAAESGLSGTPCDIRRYGAIRHFGSSTEFVPVGTIKDVFDAVESGKADRGRPQENSTEGVISYTIDLFMEYDLKISAEVMLRITHNLLSKSGTRQR